MTYNDPIVPLIDAFDLPGFIASQYPEMDIEPGRGGLYHAVWRHDQHKSFSIYRKRKGRCWLWFDHGERQGGNIKHFLMLVQNMSEQDACEFIRYGHLPSGFKARPAMDFERLTHGKAGKAYGTFECAYDYHDEHERLVLQVVRWRDPKSFSVRRPSPDGKHWVWGVSEGLYFRNRLGDWLRPKDGDVSNIPAGAKTLAFAELLPPLYQLPLVQHAVAKDRLVVIVDGEKDADNLTKAGFTATCVPNGNGSWKDHHAKYLSGARVVVMMDREKYGYLKGCAVAESLLGVAKDVRGPAAAPGKGKDVSDFLLAGGQVETLETLFGKLSPFKARGA